MAVVRLYDSTICRLCAEDNGNGELLYRSESDHTDLSSMVNRYLPLKVRKTFKYTRILDYNLTSYCSLNDPYGGSTGFRYTSLLTTTQIKYSISFFMINYH